VIKIELYATAAMKLHWWIWHA